MENKIKLIIIEHKLDVAAITSCKNKESIGFRIAIATGNTEGYYVSITTDDMQYFLRIHDSAEALKALGVMLLLFPNN